MTLTAPTSRWTRANLDPRQAAFWLSTATINAVPACRRSWKTEGAKRRLVRAALSPSPHAGRRFFACAPTHQQSRDIFWADLCQLVPRWALATGNPDRDIRASDLSIHLRDGSIIRVAGLDRPSRIEGGFADGVIVDEYGDCRPDVLSEHIVPMMVRAGSYIDVIGTPAGRNHWYALVEQIKGGDLPNAAHFTWTGSEVLHLYLGRERAEAVLAQARATMDADSFDQEFNASFVSVRDVVYYGFSPEDHIEPSPYDPTATLFVGFDFNVSPGVAILCQERRYRGDNPKADRTEDVTCCIDEIWIEQNSNTRKVCAELLRRYGAHEGEVWVYADASGASGHSSQTSGSDLDLIEKCLSPVFGSRTISDAGGVVMTYRSRLTMDVPASNPAVRVRINSVNARLRAVDGTIRTRIDPKCQRLIRDFEGVQYKKGTGDIDKAGAPDLSHLSDAFGYYCHRRHPMTEDWMIVTQF